MKTVLIADDQAICRQGIRQILTQDNEFVIAGEVKNFSELQEKLGTHYDLIIMNPQMPGGPGLELLQK